LLSLVMAATPFLVPHMRAGDERDIGFGIYRYGYAWKGTID
jgi:hypothetical protein